MFSPTNDTFEAIRRHGVPMLGALVHVYNEATDSDLYVEGKTTRSQFVGRVPMGEEAFEDELERMGFERNPLASFKRLVGTRLPEEGSFRWVGSQKAPWTSDYDDDYQLHVIIYDGEVVPDAETGETYVYAHWEVRWDSDPVAHYFGEGLDIEQGVEMAQQFLDHYGIDYDQQRPR